MSYDTRNVKYIIENSFTRVIITLTSLLSVISLLIRNWTYVFWMDFKNAKALQVKFMELQDYNLNTEERARAGDDAPQYKNIKFQKESHFKKWLEILFSSSFLFEVFLLIIHPLPYYDKEYTFYILNMLSSKDAYVPVHYYLGDFLFAFMFMRVYFLIRTIFNFSIYQDLNSRKICTNNRFESNTSFCLKAFIRKSPGTTILFTAVLSVMWLSYLLRIFEKYLPFMFKKLQDLLLEPKAASLRLLHYSYLVCRHHYDNCWLW